MNWADIAKRKVVLFLNTILLITRVSPIHDPSNPIYSQFFEVSYTCFEQYILAPLVNQIASFTYSWSIESHLLSFFWKWVIPASSSIILALHWSFGSRVPFIVIFLKVSCLIWAMLVLYFFDALWVPPQCAKLIAAVMPRAQPWNEWNLKTFRRQRKKGWKESIPWRRAA